MALLRIRDASFANATAQAGPLTLDLEAGGRLALAFATSLEATIVALMAAGIAKATTGSVLIGDYDPRVQSVHCKRLAGFVPHEPLQLDEGDFPRYIAYRAALWNVETAEAQEYARRLSERLEGMHEAFSYPLIGALVASPQLIVLDRPQPAYAAQILRAVEGRALLSTHAQPSNAAAFT
ncbi:MAG: hypothetical protein ABSF08_01500 [Candidatus Cybelea sp.]|jgi:ABC-type uncharacterized transport system ATPase subunit